jgi:hypothetical protein
MFLRSLRAVGKSSSNTLRTAAWGGRCIGLCYLPAAKAAPGVKIQVLVRQAPVDAETVLTPT